MARYSLIMRDTTYTALLLEAQSEQKTFGKHLNEILDAHIQPKTSEIVKTCFFCKREATHYVTGYNDQIIVVCCIHELDYCKPDKCKSFTKIQEVLNNEK